MLHVVILNMYILMELNLKMYRKAKRITSLDALFEHTAQGLHWLVVGLESVPLPQAVHTPGVDSLLEQESWTPVIGHLIPHYLLKREL